jgi:predicted enzyme related to lactoylglutathione lyase
MTETTSHAPGDFCWVELSTSDETAAKQFYTTLFGWTNVDTPIPGGVYVVLQKNGRDAAALMQNPKIPPAWVLYVAVTSADESSAKAASLGGTVLAPPFDVMDLGRMAVIQDPSGAVFSLWEPKKNPGIGVKNESGAFCWGELTTPDPAKCEPFYTQLFGWRAKASSDSSMPYTEWHLGDRAIAGMMETPKEMPGIPPHWMPYFAVDDCDATVAQAKSLGVTEVFGPMDIPHVGRFAIINDPQGARFAVIKLAM